MGGSGLSNKIKIPADQLHMLQALVLEDAKIIASIVRVKIIYIYISDKQGEYVTEYNFLSDELHYHDCSSSTKSHLERSTCLPPF